jgi:hypothetical protein
MLDHLAAVRSLKLPEGSYVVIGGSGLAVRGIRESNDIDMVVTHDLFKELQNSGWPVDEEFKQKWNRVRLKREPFEIYTDIYLERSSTFIPAEKLIKDAELIQGMPFISIRDLLFYKADNPRPKDIADITLIAGYLSQNQL